MENCFYIYINSDDFYLIKDFDSDINMIIFNLIKKIWSIKYKNNIK